MFLSLNRRVSLLILVVYGAGMLGSASRATTGLIKATVVSTTLKGTSGLQWFHDLGYQNAELYQLIFPSSLGCPFVKVEVSGVQVPLMLDSGLAQGFLVTNQAPLIPYRVESRKEELNPDGSHRGESTTIRVDRVSVLGASFKDVAGSLSDWRMFSSVPFPGAVGLDFFLDRRLTMDYRSGRVAASVSPLPGKLDPERYLVVDLIDPPRQQGHILYARARVNRRDAIIYFDTGYIVSFIDPGFSGGLTRSERPGQFKVFRRMVPVEMGGYAFVLDNLRESPVHRGTGFDLPVALALGSDFLSNFIVTIDLRAKKLILALAE